MSDQVLSEITEPTELNELETLRHSTAHIMAHAISRLFPDAKFGIGPTVENGFYYDVQLEHKLTPEDLFKIEREMGRVMKENAEFKRTEHTIEEAKRYLTRKGVLVRPKE